MSDLRKSGGGPIKQAPAFLERHTYRKRRIMDAARLLPILGVFLLCMPLLWPVDAENAPSTSRAIIYVFGVWLLLIGAALGLASRLKEGDGPVQPGQSDI